MSNRSYSRVFLFAALSLAAIFSLSLLTPSHVDAAAECPTDYLLGFFSDRNPVYSSENRRVFFEEGESLGTHGSRITPIFPRNTEFPLTVSASGLPSGVTVGKVTDGDNFYWSFKGTPRNEGESEVTLTAQSSLCGNDTGFAVAYVAPDQGALEVFTDNAWVLPGTATGATLTGKIYDIHQIPYLWHAMTTPFRNVLYLSDGYFVVSGQCSIPVHGALEGPRAAALGGGNNQGLPGGLYGFTTSGEYIGKQNVCADGGIPGPSLSQMERNSLGCNELGDCEAVSKVLPTGGDTFIREMTAPDFYADNRPPLAYRLTANGFRLMGTAYDTDHLLNWGDPEPQYYGMQLTGNLVPVGDMFLGIKQVNAWDEGSYVNQSNIVYSSNLSKLKEWTIPMILPPGPISGSHWPTKSEKITPLAGIGDFVIGQKTYSYAHGAYDNKAYLFKLNSNDELEEVRVLTGDKFDYIHAAYDPLNKNRVAFHTYTTGQSGTVDLYEASESDIRLVSSRDVPIARTSFYGSPGFAILGDYLMYPTPWDPTHVTDNTADPFFGCATQILNGTDLVAQIVLPKFRGYGKWAAQEDPVPIDDCPSAMGMGPDGDIVIGTHWGALYHYTLGGSTGMGDDDDDDSTGTSTPPVVPGIGIGGINDLLTFAGGYLKALQLIMGTQGGVSSDIFDGLNLNGLSF